VYQLLFPAKYKYRKISSSKVEQRKRNFKLNNKIKPYFTIFFVVRDNSITRGHPYKVMLEHCDNNSQKQFLSQRIAKIWISLPAAAIDFTNLVSFKASLQNINLCIFTRF